MLADPLFANLDRVEISSHGSQNKNQTSKVCFPGNNVYVPTIIAEELKFLVLLIIKDDLKDNAYLLELLKENQKKVLKRCFLLSHHMKL